MFSRIRRHSRILAAGAALCLLPTAAAAQELGTIAGTVSNTFGELVPGVLVTAVSLSGYQTTATTGEDGAYEFEPMPIGTYSLTFQREAYTPADAEAVVTAGAAATVSATLGPAGNTGLTGLALDDQGLVLPGAVAELRRDGEQPLTAFADDSGRFTFQDVRPGPGELAVTMPGFLEYFGNVHVALGQMTEVEAVLQLDYAVTEEVVVVGSRRATGQRTTTDSTVPVDVFSADELTAQPHADMAEVIRSLAPSFNVSTQPISDAATVIRPVNLRNLAPDHLLVLVDGKRRHRGAVIAWLGNGLSDGSQGPDISSIPTIALRQAELLKDGAAAQYGSDAIAGVLNFRLKDARQGGSVELNTGTFLTPNSGDRATCRSPSADYSHPCDALGGLSQASSFAANTGLPIGQSGFANLSIEVGQADPTNRAVQRADARALIDQGNPYVRDTAQVWGRPAVKHDLKSFANLGGQIGLYRPYAQLGYAQREVLGGFYYRHPHTRGGVFEGPDVAGEPTLLVGDRRQARTGGAESAGCPPVPIRNGRPDPDALRTVEANPDCFTLYSRFPGGFTPQFGGVIRDASGVAGVRYLRPDGLGWDLSASMGRSFIGQRLTSSVNASLGWDTPTDFEPGTAEQTETNLHFDATVPMSRGFHLATGAEWRNEVFALTGGDEASWRIGPYAAQGFSSGSNGFTGYRPDTAAGRWGRSNVAAYVDLERRRPDDPWTVGGALRWERFSDFGQTLNGKATARYAFNGQLALRGAVSTGFRAPTPGQQNAFNVTTAFLGGRLVNRGVVPPTSAVAIARGGRQLQPERSRHASLGLVHERPRMQVALDLFAIDVRDRLALSQEINLTPDEVEVLISEGIREARNFPVFRFFVNDFGTTTAGADLTWVHRPASWATLGASLNYTRTRLHSLAGRVIDTFRIHTLENGLPETRWQLWARPALGRWSLLIRYNWYGGYWDSEDGNNATGIGMVEEPWFYPSYPGRGLLDVEGAYELHEGAQLAVGVQNALATYPALNPHAELTVGNQYGQFSPFGFDGAYLYARLSYSWSGR